MAVKLDSKARLKRTRADRLSVELSKNLKGPKFRRLIKVKSEKYFCVQGVLPINSGESFSSDIKIRIFSNWRDSPPTVICEEPWVRRHIDWHVYRTGELCWVLPKQWKDAVSSFERRIPTLSLCESSAFFLLRNVEYLLKCHRIGYEKGEESWNPEWSEFLHDKEGVEQYLRELEQIQIGEAKVIEDANGKN